VAGCLDTWLPYDAVDSTNYTNTVKFSDCLAVRGAASEASQSQGGRVSQGGREHVDRCCVPSPRYRTLAGLPATVTPGGTSRVTTLPAPMMASSPTVMPGRRIAPLPIQTLRPMRIGLPLS
jgi:hypothetical protein